MEAVFIVAVCGYTRELFCPREVVLQTMLKWTELCVGVLDGAAASVMSGLL